MKYRGIMITSALSIPLYVAAQSEVKPETPEEIIVVGRRTVMELRLDMWNAEVLAYEVFNTFNDEARFDISCSLHQISGTRLDRQLCQPEFEIQAMAQQGRNFLESYRAFLDPLYQGPAGVPSFDGAPPVSRPASAAIASQQEAYRAKMKQVAEEHPAFLNALIKYSEARGRYEAATRTGEGTE